MGVSEDLIKVILETCSETNIKAIQYSGRNMFGKRCLGFVMNNGAMTDFVRFVLKISSNLTDGEYLNEYEEFICDVYWRSDNLGYDTVFYSEQLVCDTELFSQYDF